MVRRTAKYLAIDGLARTWYSVSVRKPVSQTAAVQCFLAMHATGATTNSASGVTDLAKVAPAMEVGTITVSTRALVPVWSRYSHVPSSECELSVIVIFYIAC